MGRKSLVVLTTATVIVAGAVAVLWGAEPLTPSLTVTSPEAGAALQPGETRVISWKTTGVPANDHVSITLQRIPPPPLPAEGQGFDPIIFTGLPNTGSTTWTISPQYPDGTYKIAVNAYESVPVTGAVSGESPAFTITHPVLSSDIYPLYGGADWNKPQVERFTIGTTTYSGASVASVPVIATMNPSAVFTPFENYYAQKLRSLGYAVDNQLAAGGHTGGQTAYRRGSSLVLTRFSIVYRTVPTNAPSECPCDVTVSVFSNSR